MIILTIQLPEWLLKSIEALAGREGYSVDQFLASAAAEKLAATMTVNYLRPRSSRRTPRRLREVPGRHPGR